MLTICLFVGCNLLFKFSIDNRQPDSSVELDSGYSATLRRRPSRTNMRLLNDNSPPMKSQTLAVQRPSATPTERVSDVAVSVVAVLVREDERQLSGFLENLLQQTIFKTIEVLVATFEDEISAQAVSELQRFTSQYPNIRRVHFQVAGGRFTVRFLSAFDGCSLTRMCYCRR